MRATQRIIFLIAAELFFCFSVSATFSFPSLSWFNDLNRKFKNVNGGGQGRNKDSIFFPSDNLPRNQHSDDFHFGQKPLNPRGQQLEEFNFESEPNQLKGQELEEFHFGPKQKGQEVEEINFGFHPKHKGQEVEEINFGHHTEDKGQEVEEINFGHHPHHPTGQEVEEINFGHHPDDHHKGQEIEEINFGHHPKDKGQEVEEINFGHHPHHPTGQEVEEINFGHHPDDHHKGQEIEEINFGHHPKDKGQEVEEINFGHRLDHPTGQELEEIKFGHHPDDHPKGQEVEEINFGHHPDHPTGQEVEEINFGPHSDHPKGQEVEEINFGHHSDHPKGQEVEEIKFGPHSDHPKGQEVEEINFGHHPDHPKGQEVEEINFGHHPDHPKGQEVEEIKFGHHPDDYHKGQEVEEINFGHHPDHPTGQEVEEINFGPHPDDHPKGQEVEEINFGHHPEDHHKGQEVEEINFGHHPKDKGQELEEINFSHHPDKKVTEFDFEKRPENHKDQEVEEVTKPKIPLEESKTTPKQETEKYSVTQPNGDVTETALPMFEEKVCLNKPEVPFNSVLNCESDRKCVATCHEGYQFENRENLTFECEGDTWVILNHEGVPPTCQPVCSPSCQNDGVCFAPNQCECQPNFHGPQCQFEEKPCENHPPVAQNSQVHCNSSVCVVECFYSYSFPDGSTQAHLICQEGHWVVERKDWNALPDCKPSCTPPCINGGTCLDYNNCQCPRQYAGPQCQYEISACDGQKLNFNGAYTCRGESDAVTCTLSCPYGYTTDEPLAYEYICHYSTGKFSPEPVPKCVYRNNTEVIKFASSSHVIQGGFENFESSKFGKPTAGECSNWKGSHYKTFDGKVFSFDGYCSYILAQDAENFRIVVENSICQPDHCPRLLKIFYLEKEYELSKKDGLPVLLMDGQIQPIPVQLYEFSIEKKGNQILVHLQSVDLSLIWDEDRVIIKANSNLWNQIAGLCGNFNGDPEDDMKDPQGLSSWSLELFVHSWADNIYDCDSNPKFDRPCQDNSAFEYCHQILTNSHFEKCFNVEKFKSYQEACTWDVCSCGKACACETIREFSEACKKYLVSEGLPDSTSEWRHIANCHWNCPPGKIYSACGPSIEPSCGTSGAIENVAKYSACAEGCFCPDGMILLNDTCVKKENCPCYWRNKTHESGERIAKGCNTCTCQNGEWVCTNLKCESRCSVTGDPHYLTFDGRRYDFMGRCTYYLVKSNNFTVEAENSPCSQDLTDVVEIFSNSRSEVSSCVKSVSINYGKDKIQLKKHKEISINDIEVSALPAVINGVIIRSASSLYLRVTLPDDTDIWWDGNTNVYIDIRGNHEGTLGGLCGTLNNNQKDDFMTPEGDVEQSSVTFAEKWKTDETCMETIDPLGSHPCDSNSNHKNIAEKYCQKLKDNLFKDCHAHVDVKPFYKNCLYDVCKCQKDPKFCFCPIFADYGMECLRHDIEVPWRTEMRECGLHCPSGEIYRTCGDGCSRTCQDISLGERNCNKKCIEGCNCPEGMSLDSSGRCIPISKCPCFHQGLRFKPNHEIIMEGEHGPQFCICENALWTCRPATKLEIDRDYENSNVKCNATMHEVYTTCEPAEPKTCKNMHEKPKHSTRICFPGCVCQKGYVWDSIGKVCVNATECPCHHGGRSYGDGEKIQEGCNTCTCKDGLWSCTKRECPAVCSTWGDSHFKTFDGRLFDFQGSCDFVLATGSISEYDTFVISLQIVPCGSTGISCPKAVTLKVGSPLKEEEVVFKKSNPTLIPKGLERILVREVGVFVFAEVFDLGITVQWDKGTRVYLKIDPKWKNRVKGLCGNFNDDELDDFKTPSSGETSEISSVLFADSWRLQSYCPESYQIPDTCARRPHRRRWAVEKCSILKSEVFEPCHSEVPFESYLERCIIDTCGCDEGGDCECLCTAIAAYAEECTFRGIAIKWRSQELCGLQCDEHSQYSACVPACPPKSCDNQYQHSALLQTCSEESCVEGCKTPSCPPGHVLADSSSSRCIPLTSCRTVCLTVNNVTYLEGDLMESDDCHSCFCSHHSKTCTGKPCSEVTATTIHLLPEITPTEESVTTPSPTTSGCPPGQVWDDCIVSCSHTCHYLEKVLKSHSQCSNGEGCVSGCRDVNLKCPFGLYLRDENTCVPKKDCPCLSPTNTTLKPGDVTHDTECEKCQCINNELECFSVCSTQSFSYTSPHPTANYTRRRFTATTMMEFGHEGNVTLIFHTTPKTTSFICNSGEYNSLIDDFTKFSASSQLDEDSSPQQGRLDSSKSWIAATDNGDQYIQIDLGRVEPIYAVEVAGANGKYVTSYHLLHSLNGNKFLDIINQDGKKEVFGGPFDGHHSVKQALPVPIEARYIRFHPLSWHEGISMKVDVLGCRDSLVSTTPQPVPPICSKPIGIGQKYFPKLKVTVTSSKPHTGPDFIGFDNEKGWQPLTNSKSEWVQLDFGDFVNFTGIITKGISLNNEISSTFLTESWVERYKVEYSQDGLTWNPVLDEFGKEMVFMGNSDSESPKKNYFKLPIHAKALKILPIKWHDNIGLRLDVMGCYEPPSMEVEVTPPIRIPKTDCNVCKGVLEEDEHCKCSGDSWWDGEKCVNHSECPCYVGLIAYPVGTSFTTEKCEECICRLYGVSHCIPKSCDDCPHGLQKVLTPLCGCTCKPCEENTRLCPTSNVCLEESAWCDGVQDCPDDEFNCTTPPPKITPTPKPCIPSCPPGYTIVNKTSGPSEAEDMLFVPKRVKSIKSKKSVKTYKSSKKSRKYLKMEKLTECPPYDCVPVEEVTPTACPPPECPLDYSVIYKKQVQNLEGACPLYTCEPVIEFDNCTVFSRNIKTFDGTEYKYDICDHILARHDLEAWNVSMVKTCSYASPCVSNVLIHHGNHLAELYPHNKSIKFDSFPYTYSQAELLNSNMADFSFNPIGNSIIFTSELYGFMVVCDGNGNVKVTVPSSMKKHINGLCGLYNGHPSDDKTLPDGNIAKTTVEFGDSWYNPGGQECVETVCSIEIQKMALEICLTLKNEPFVSCPKEINMEVCIETACNCLTSNKTKEECKCQTLSDHVTQCNNPDLFGWRVDHDCPSSCPPNLVHYDCYPYECEPTCINDEECTKPASDCYSGCFCPDGLVKKGDQCIKLQDCRDCVCSGMGDSTYLTFDGGLTFNGNCTYVATREKDAAGNPGFEVLITNNLCNGSDFMTCTEKLEVKASDHSVKIIALPDIEEKVLVLVDGHSRSLQDLAKFDESWSKIEVSPETSSIQVKLPKEHVDVAYFYKRFAFTISLPSHYYSDKVEGLCGTCSQKGIPEEMEEPEIWQTEKGENCLLEPPTVCAPTPEHEKLCFFMNDTNIFAQCTNFVDPAPFIDQCLALLCHNGHVCDILESFSQACRDVGICIDWRSDDFCPFTCPSDLEYQACKNGCHLTCEDYEDSSCSKPPIEGCFCPDDQILNNGTCKPGKFCKYCDEEGRHYEDEFWQVDACTTCSCKNKIVTCSKVECPVVNLNCKEDEIPVVEKNETECCPSHKCGCKPRNECPEIDLSNEVLPIGMKVIVNESGCCPRVETICEKDSCPEVKPCRSHFIQKVVNASDCCPQHICEKPDDLCIYILGHSKKERVGREIQEEIVKKIGESWNDGPCKSCVCVETNGIAEAVCMVTECSQLEEHQDFHEYELSHVYNPEKCCPEVVRNNCKHNGTIYKVGDSWMPDDSNPCETMKCNNLDGLVLKEMRMEVCTTECELGWEMKRAEGECCGRCVQTGCVAGDKVFKDGEVWFSEDGCSKSSCVGNNGHFFISTMTESCPKIDDCPEEDIYRDKCCLKCKIRAEDKRLCIPHPVPPESTVKLIREKVKRHGLCQNLAPVTNFTQCAGNCDSYTIFKPETLTHESVCKCCQPEEFSILTVELECVDGKKIMKSLTVPSKCNCMPCGG